MRWIKRGIRIPFSHTPPRHSWPRQHPSPPVTQSDRPWLSAELDRLLLSSSFILALALSVGDRSAEIAVPCALDSSSTCKAIHPSTLSPPPSSWALAAPGHRRPLAFPGAATSGPAFATKRRAPRAVTTNALRERGAPGEIAMRVPTKERRGDVRRGLPLSQGRATV